MRVLLTSTYTPGCGMARMIVAAAAAGAIVGGLVTGVAAFLIGGGHPEVLSTPPAVVQNASPVAVGASPIPTQAQPLTVAQAPALAPPPREAEDTRSFTRSVLNERAVGSKSEIDYEIIVWRVETSVRRLASTKKDVIDLHWGIKYTGPRPPLHILRPSLTGGWPEQTVALVSAIPQGKEDGREVKFAYRGDDFSLVRTVAEGNPREWFVREKGGEWATGTETISVPELKAILQSRYPDEFPPGCPPPRFMSS